MILMEFMMSVPDTAYRLTAQPLVPLYMMQGLVAAHTGR